MSRGQLIRVACEEAVSLSAGAFLASYFGKRPVILRGAVSSWPAVKSEEWQSFKALSRYPLDAHVNVERGAKFTDLNSHATAHSFDPAFSLPWRDFLSYLQPATATNTVSTSSTLSTSQVSSDILYLAQSNLLDMCPELAQDIGHVPLAPSIKPLQRLLWIGPAHTYSPMHYDPYHNTFCQVAGSKRCLMIQAEKKDKRLAPLRGFQNRNKSSVDFTMDAEALQYHHPELCELPQLEAVLHPGDVLYIPRYCWHDVRATTPAINVTYWW